MQNVQRQTCTVIHHILTCNQTAQHNRNETTASTTQANVNQRCHCIRVRKPLETRALLCNTEGENAIPRTTVPFMYLLHALTRIVLLQLQTLAALIPQQRHSHPIKSGEASEATVPNSTSLDTTRPATKSHIRSQQITKHCLKSPAHAHIHPCNHTATPQPSTLLMTDSATGRSPPARTKPNQTSLTNLLTTNRLENLLSFIKLPIQDLLTTRPLRFQLSPPQMYLTQQLPNNKTTTCQTSLHQKTNQN